MINGYAAAIIVACLAGLIWLGQSEQWVKDRRSTGPRLSPVERIDGALISLGAGLLGARIAFVLTHWDYYADHVWESPWFWQGGLSWIGGAIGATAALAIYAGALRKPVLALTDAMAAPATLFSIGAWVGCLFDGCAYGRQASFGWLTPASPDLLGNIAPRWPTQTAGALVGVALLVVLLTLGRRKLPPGLLGCLAVAVLSGSSLALEFVRADPTPIFNGVRLEALGEAAFLAASAIGLMLLGRIRNQEAG